MDWQPEWLLKAEIKAVMTTLLAGLMAGGGWLISRRWAKTGIVALDETEGHTTTAPSVSVLAIICALFALAIFVFGEVYGVDDSVPNDRLAWALLIVGFGAGSFLLALMTGFRWRWDAQGISYTRFGLTRRLSWDDLVQYVRRSEGASFVRGKSGKKIIWTKYTMHPEVLAAAIARYRPDLVPAA
jgi:hypothetical protein